MQAEWFARAVSDETFDLAKLAEHMSKTQFTVFRWCHQRCTFRHGRLHQELLLDGQNV